MKCHSNKRIQSGFTLIEIVIVVAIVGILASIAYSSYQDQTRKARRAEGKGFLMEIASAQERYFTQNVRYGTLVQLGYPNENPQSEEEFYNVRITASTNTTFTLTATPVIDDPDCGNLTLTNTNLRGSDTNDPDCWN
ncbi:type IV pilin protein [Porticoccus sp. GXU_MW_L64]